MAIEISTPITLENLNTVYQDLRRRISSIGNVYHVKGTTYWSGIKTLDSADSGDVYNIKIDNEHPTPAGDERFYNGVNIYCKQAFSTSITDFDTKWGEYWEVLEGMLEEATTDTAGVIKLGGEENDTKNADVKEGTGIKVVRGLKLTTNGSSSKPSESSKDTPGHEGHQAYIDIPLATSDTYGVVSTNSQNFSGAKTFNDQVSIKGTLNLSEDSEVVVNSLQANSILLGGVKITAQNGVITFSAINT